MEALNSLTWQAALAALDQAGIVYRVAGPEQPIAKACSLLHKEPRGLYYYSGEPPGPFSALSESAVVCAQRAWGDLHGNTAILVQGDPQLAFYKLCARLFSNKPAAGIHATAIIHPDAIIGHDVHIGPYAVVGRARIGDGTVLHAHVVVMDGCAIGENVVVEPNSLIGGSGVAWVWDENDLKVALPQVGGVLIENDVFIGSDVTVVRGMLNERTTIGARTMIAHGSKIGHSAVLGVQCHLANNVSIAGSVTVGARSFLGSGCVLRPHVKLAEGTIVGVGAAVVSDVHEPNTTVAGVPAKTILTKAKAKGVPTTPRSSSQD